MSVVKGPSGSAAVGLSSVKPGISGLGTWSGSYGSRTSPSRSHAIWSSTEVGPKTGRDHRLFSSPGFGLQTNMSGQYLSEDFAVDEVIWEIFTPYTATSEIEQIVDTYAETIGAKLSPVDSAVRIAYSGVLSWEYPQIDIAPASLNITQTPLGVQGQALLRTPLVFQSNTRCGLRFYLGQDLPENVRACTLRVILNGRS